MRLATGVVAGQPVVGMLTADSLAIDIFDLPAAAASRGVLALVERGAAALPTVVRRLPLAELALLAPIPRPVRNLLCVGKNYREHAQEFAKSGFDSSAGAGAVPDDPIVFSKLPECVIASGAPIPIDQAVTTAVDYEAELAVVIGRGGRGITRDAAMAHVFGYTIVNDITARDLQIRHKQWLIAKSQDGFCPMGPWLVTADALDGQAVDIRCWVNGELRQDSNTRHLIFDIPTLIATISAGITLVPGDVIATGTPAGVAVGFNPPRYLAPGDTVRVEIAGIGVLENPVVARDAVPARTGAAA